MGRKSTPMEWYNEVCRRNRQRKVKAVKASQQDEQKPWGAFIPGAPCVLLESTITGVGERGRGLGGWGYTSTKLPEDFQCRGREMGGMIQFTQAESHEHFTGEQKWDDKRQDQMKCWSARTGKSWWGLKRDKRGLVLKMCGFHRSGLQFAACLQLNLIPGLGNGNP